MLHPHLRPARRNGEKNSWGGARKGRKEQKFGGMGKGTEEASGSESIKDGHTPSEASGSSVTQSMQLTELLTQLNSLLQQQTSGFVHSKFNFNSCKINNSFKAANLCHNTNKWIIDLGVTNHMTCNQNKLENITQVNNPQHVIVANGDKVKIHGIGTTKFLTKNVKDILYLPDFNSNLLSVSKITQELNCNVIFSPNKVTFQDRESEKTIGEG